MSETKDGTPPAHLPEAGGVAWTKVYAESGAEIVLTSRAVTLIDALDDLAAAMKYASQKYRLMSARDYYDRKQAETAPAPAPAPAEADPQADVFPGEETERIQVDRFEVQATAKGQPILKVFGGRWSKFGVTCWPETSPVDLSNYAIGDTWQAQPGTFATVLLNEKGNPSKVLAFA